MTGSPPETQLPRSAVPMFPLPGVFLFPRQLLPLHVFEPRYRQLVEDLLDSPGRFVLGTITAAGADAEPPQVLPVAGLGELVRHERTPDGRYHVWVVGLQRVRIEEVPSDRSYRRVRCLPFAEIPVPPDDAPQLRYLLREATQARVQQTLPLPEDTPTGVLTDLLVQTVPLPPAQLERIYAEPAIAERARQALAAARRHPPPSME